MSYFWFLVAIGLGGWVVYLKWSIHRIQGEAKEALYRTIVTAKARLRKLSKYEGIKKIDEEIHRRELVSADAMLKLKARAEEYAKRRRHAVQEEIDNARIKIQQDLVLQR